MIKFNVRLPDDFRGADRIRNKLTETFGASEEEINLQTTTSDEYRAIETAILVAIVSAAGSALGAFVTGLLKLLSSGAAQNIVISSGNSRIEVPKNATAEQVEKLVDAIRRLEGKNISLDIS